MNDEMFELYNEPARRSLFFARYEASMLGSLTIGPEHLLLGVLKDRGPIITHLLGAANVNASTLRQIIYGRAGVSATPLDVSIEIPFNTDSKEVLRYTAEEADRLLHGHIGPEHLLLGLLRLQRGLASDILREHGLALNPVREALVMHVSATMPPPPEVKQLLAGMLLHDVGSPRPSETVYELTAISGPNPGRRAVTDDMSGAFSSASAVSFATRVDPQPDGRVARIGPISMSATTLAQFVLVLEAFLGRPVIDSTGLSGLFDIELRGEYDDELALTAALREQLGLVLIKSL